jgi:hypothetical protein
MEWGSKGAAEDRAAKAFVGNINFLSFLLGLRSLKNLPFNKSNPAKEKRRLKINGRILREGV